MTQNKFVGQGSNIEWSLEFSLHRHTLMIKQTHLDASISHNIKRWKCEAKNPFTSNKLYN